MKIEICVGSSCHLKGAHDIVELFQQAIAKHHLDASITLAGSFCMGNCSDKGVSVRFNETQIVGVTVDNFDDIFEEYVLKNC